MPRSRYDSIAAAPACLPAKPPATQKQDSPTVGAGALVGHMVRTKDGRHGTVVAHGVDGPYAVDVGGGGLVPILDRSPIHPERDVRNQGRQI